MKIEQLRQLLEVSKTKSINQAAANMFISQPNLSLSLRNLETELGYPLFIRNNRGIELTVQGIKFVEFASSVLLQFDHLKSLYDPGMQKAQASFSLANMRFRYVVEVAALLYAQHQKTDPFKLFLQENNSDGVIDLVYRGECELGILNIWSTCRKEVSALLKAKSLQCYRLSSNAPTIVVGLGSPLYSASPDLVLEPAMLKDCTHVMYEQQDCGFYNNWAMLLGLPQPAGEIVVASRAALYEILNQTNSFTIATTNRSAYKHAEYYPTARSFDISSNNISCEVCWIKRRDYIPTPIAFEFLQMLSTYYA